MKRRLQNYQLLQQLKKEGIQLGAIAQEIEKVFPDMVTTQSD